METSNYRPRIADEILREKLEGMGAVLIEGPKWCGKTTTAEQQAQSVLYMDDPTKKAMNLNNATLQPKLLLDGKTPRLIDEWQIAPQLWDAVRFEVDHRGADGQFILTGSAVPLIGEEDRLRMHSGTGRIARVRMRPMSLWESGDSTGKVSLRELFDGAEPSAVSDTDLNQVAFLTCRGGWPRATMQKPNIALGRAQDYYDAVVNFDIQRVDGVLRNSSRAAKLMRSFARLQGSQAPLSAICEDMKSTEGQSFDDRTVASYLNALKLIFVVEDMPAWNPNLRSKTAIRTSDTHYFIDPSIAVAALGLGPDDLIRDLNTFGFLFECLCVRDLRVYADALKGNVFHFRDKDGLECDAVIHLRNGRYGLIEVKLGGERLIDEGAANLLKLASKLDTSRMKAPSFLMILVATGAYAFRRPDGVFVVPISCLKD
jgi:predicted AAA+ superfamily ATPase